MHLWNWIWASARNTVITLCVLLLIALFVWRKVNPQDFANTLNGFMRDIMTLMQFIMVLAVIVGGVAIMCGWRPFKKSGGGKGH